MQAKCKAVLPLLSLAFRSMPNSFEDWMSNWAVSVWPFLQAKCQAVLPMLFLAFRSMPKSFEDLSEASETSDFQGERSEPWEPLQPILLVHSCPTALKKRKSLDKHQRNEPPKFRLSGFLPSPFSVVATDHDVCSTAMQGPFQNSGLVAKKFIFWKLPSPIAGDTFELRSRGVIPTLLSSSS